MITKVTRLAWILQANGDIPMCRTTVNSCLIMRPSTNVISLQARPAASLGALLLAVSLPASSLAAVAGANGGSRQPGASVQSGRGATGGQDTATGSGRQVVMQVR